MKIKWTYEKVKENIESTIGYFLESTTYINVDSKLKIRCSNNHIFEMSFYNFRKGQRCSICAGNKRHDIENIKKFSKEDNYICLSNEYKNNHTKLKFQCPKGHLFEMKFLHFKRGHRCAICSGNKKHTIEIIKEYTSKFLYNCLSNVYINAHTKLEFQCPKGHKFEMLWNCFQQGQRCSICKYLNRTGENNHNWNPNRDEISLNQRLRIKRKISWIKNNLKSDPNYNNYLNNPNQYHIDHIIPISAFCKYMIENNLDEKEIKRIANDKRNIQILPIQENLQKRDSYDKQILNEYVNKYYKSKKLIDY